jgi:hypothetical protein
LEGRIGGEDGGAEVKGEGEAGWMDKVALYICSSE